LLIPRISSKGRGDSDRDMVDLLRVGAGALEDAGPRGEIEEHRQRGRADRAGVGAERAAYERRRAARFGRGGDQCRAQAGRDRVEKARIGVGVEHDHRCIDHAQHRAQRGRKRVDAIVDPFVDGRQAAGDACFEIGAIVDRLAVMAQMTNERMQRRAREQDVPRAARRRRGGEPARRYRNHGDVARIAGHAAQAVAVDRDAAANRRPDEQVDEIVALPAVSVEQFGDRGRVAVVFAEHGQRQRAAEVGREIDVFPRAERVGREAELAHPRAEVIRLRDADAGQARAVMVGEQGLHRVDVLTHDFEHVGGGRQQRVVRAAAEHVACEVDERGLDAHPVEMDADTERAARVEADQRSGLAALAFGAAGEFDQLRVGERLDDAADRRARHVREPGEIGLRRAAHAAQRLQQQALVVTAHVGRIASLAEVRASHGVSFHVAPLGGALNKSR
jgi:hypothetical protein